MQGLTLVGMQGEHEESSTNNMQGVSQKEYQDEQTQKYGEHFVRPEQAAIGLLSFFLSVCLCRVCP